MSFAVPTFPDAALGRNTLDVGPSAQHRAQRLCPHARRGRRPIRPVGIDLIFNNLSFEQAAFRFRRQPGIDISEYSLANYCARVAAPKPAPMVALPVFPSRVFRHSSIYIRELSGIRSAGDLAGRAVGIPQWSQTATVYVRGWLMHDVGVGLDLYQWI